MVGKGSVSWFKPYTTHAPFRESKIARLTREDLIRRFCTKGTKEKRYWVRLLGWHQWSVLRGVRQRAATLANEMLPTSMESNSPKKEGTSLNRKSAWSRTPLHRCSPCGHFAGDVSGPSCQSSPIKRGLDVFESIIAVSSFAITFVLPGRALRSCFRGKLLALRVCSSTSAAQ